MLAFKMHKFEILSDRDNMMLLDGNHLEKKLISNKKLPLTLTDILFPCQQGLFFFSLPQQAQTDTTCISNTLCESLLKINKSSNNIA